MNVVDLHKHLVLHTLSNHLSAISIDDFDSSERKIKDEQRCEIVIYGINLVLARN